MRRILSEESFPVKQTSFFARQFAPQRTEAQDIFDVAFGVIAPVLCFVFDPIVFKGGLLRGSGILASYQLVAYLISAIEIATLIMWFTLGRQLNSWSALISGVLVTGAAFSALIGFLISPFTLIGLVVLIGVLGFTPFLTAFVYLRTALRAIKVEDQNSLFGRSLLAVLGSVLSIALPVLVSIEISRTISKSVTDLVYGDAQQAEVAATRLRWLPLVPEQDLNRIVEAYRREPDTEKRGILKRYYKDITGRDIDIRLRILND
jgi:hypothetical protein